MYLTNRRNSGQLVSLFIELKINLSETGGVMNRPPKASLLANWK